jgi:hypothetical protein
VRKHETITMKRIQDINKEKAARLFENLELLMTNHIFPATITNSKDESGFSAVEDPSLILAPKGQKRVETVTSRERARTKKLSVL